MASGLVQDPLRRKARRRAKLIAAACFLWLLVVVGRLVQLQVFGHRQAATRVTRQNQSTGKIQARRGTIYDRNGRILARSLPARAIHYEPNLADSVAARFEPVRRLRKTLGLADEDMARLRAQIEDGARRVYLKRKADPGLAAKVFSAREQIGYEEDTLRVYPLGRQAAHVLGGVKADGSGAAGIESKFNASLMGSPGKAMSLHDAKRRGYAYEVLEEPVNGRDLHLTLDQSIQYIAQSELERAVAATRSAWGTVIVADPLSGEILAMATAPSFDPNRFNETPGADFNRAIRHTFEPGSTFKILTAAAAIEARAVSFSETFDCREGAIAAAGGAIRDHKVLGLLDFPGVIIHSSNVGVIQFGRRLDPAAFEAVIRSFGFGRKTGIELPAEEPGLLRPQAEWSRRSLSSLAIGYEIAVTPIQLLQAVGVVASRGRLIPPRIVKAVQGGRPRSPAPSSEPVLSAAACEKLIGILERVVVEGTGREALAEGYVAAGKTGTTQKYDPAAKAYSTKRHIASFVGFVPVESPRLSVVVVLDDPQIEEHYGGQVAAPVFREVTRRALLAVGVPPSRPSRSLTAGLRKDGPP